MYPVTGEEWKSGVCHEITTAPSSVSIVVSGFTTTEGHVLAFIYLIAE